jgi:iron(III) transport system permease protein
VYHRLNKSRLAPALWFTSLVTLVIIVGLPMIAIILFAVFPKINELSLTAPFSLLIPNLTDPRLSGAIANSLMLSASVTAVAALTALPLSLLRARMSKRQGQFWDVCFLIPFLIPPYIGSLAWMQLLQRNGFIEQLFGFHAGAMLYSFTGITLVMALNLFPLIYFSASRSLMVIGSRYGDIARVCGANPLSTFFRIDLPLVLPALVSSGLIVFILTIEEFGTPEILGRRFGFEVMVTAVHDKFTNWPVDLAGASVLCCVLILLAFLAYRGQQMIVAVYQTQVDANGFATAEPSTSVLLRLLTVGVFALVAIIAVALPLASVTASAFMDTMSGGLDRDNFSLRNMQTVFAPGSDAINAILTSLSLAIAAALLTALIGFLVAFTLVRLPSRGTAMLDFLSILPNSIPGMAVAVGLILTWNLPFWPVTPYNTLLILLLAYLCLMLPYPIRMLTTALRQLPTSLDHAAYVAGANEITVVRRILAPLLAPVAFAAGFIVFAISTRELVTSLMLSPPGVETVATFVFRQFDQGSMNVGMAMSLLTILLSAVVIGAGQRLAGRTFR